MSISSEEAEAERSRHAELAGLEFALVRALPDVPSRLRQDVQSTQYATSDYANGLGDLAEEFRLDFAHTPSPKMWQQIDVDMMEVLDSATYGNDRVGRFAAVLYEYKRLSLEDTNLDAAAHASVEIEKKPTTAEDLDASKQRLEETYQGPDALKNEGKEQKGETELTPAEKEEKRLEREARNHKTAKVIKSLVHNKHQYHFNESDVTLSSAMALPSLSANKIVPTSGLASTPEPQNELVAQSTAKKISNPRKPSGPSFE